jgi:hypothetical protein
MKPFPLLAELPSFLGDEIAQVWLDPWGLRLLFASKTQLYVENKIEHTEPDGTVWFYDTQAEKKEPVVIQRLLNSKITSFHREGLCLTFEFENKAKLAIFSEIGQFESGHFLLPDGAFDVF